MATSKISVYASIAADLGIASIKFIAAAITSSAAMLSEGIHTLIDSINGLLILVGIRKSQKPADEDRPFGYGKELYFWSFIVSVLLFSLGACFSIYQGIIHIQNPTRLNHLSWSYVVLGISFLFNSFSLLVVTKPFNRERGNQSFWPAIRRSKDPSTFMILLEDAGGLIGVIIAFLGVWLGHVFNNNYLDGIASLVIGGMLMAISVVLVMESRSLLMGEPAAKDTLKDIIELTEKDEAVVKVVRHFSMYLAPEEIILQLNVVFREGLSTKQIIESIRRVRSQIQGKFPRFKQIFIEPEEGESSQPK